MIFYLFTITFGLCVSYFTLFFLFPYFFEGKGTREAKISYKSLISILIICAISFVSCAIALNIGDKEIGNRFLHIFGGGFTAFLMCFLAAKDSGLQIRKFQFFLFSFLVVISLGVLNEVIEFLLQYYFDIISANTPIDTWLDLNSNIIGILIASICFVPFVSSKDNDGVQLA